MQTDVSNAPQQTQMTRNLRDREATGWKGNKTHACSLMRARAR